MQSNGVRYKNQFKKEILDLYSSGRKVSSISQEYNVTKVTIYKWIKDRSSIELPSKEIIAAEEYQEMKKNIAELKIENEILKKYNSIFLKKTIDQIIEFIDSNKDVYDVRQMCKVLNISKSTYYDVLNLRNNQNTEEKAPNVIIKTISDKNSDKGSKKDSASAIKEEALVSDIEESEPLYNNIYNLAIFKEINNDQCSLVKEELLKKLKINTTYNVENEPNDIIGQIYKHCSKEAYSFSWTSIKNEILTKYNIKEDQEDDDTGYVYNGYFLEKEKISKPILYDGPTYDDSVYEDAICEHCTIAALYTVEYLMYKDTYVPTSQLGHRMKGMGHNFALYEYKKRYKIKHAKIAFNRLGKYEDAFHDECDENSEYIYNEDKKDKIRINSGKFKKLSNSYFLKKVLDLKIHDKGEKIEREVPLFLSNFSYCILDNLGESIKMENIINKLNENTKKSSFEENLKDLVEDSIIERKRTFIEKYLKYVDDIYCYEEYTTEVDKILFKYEKEHQLNSYFIKYCVDSGMLNENVDIDLDIIKTIMSFPNVFSRNIFIDYFYYLCNNYGFYSASDAINELYEKTIPIFEKTFFVSLYEYCMKNRDENETLRYMDELLTIHIKNNFGIIMKNNEDNNSKYRFNKGKITTYKFYESKEKVNKVYELLKFNFRNLFNLREDLKKDYREEIYFMDKNKI